MTKTWTSERDAALRQHHEDGLSYVQISDKMSEQFDEFISRNACVGRASRIGLTEGTARQSSAASRREQIKHLQKEQPKRAPRRTRRHYSVTGVKEFAAAPQSKDEAIAIAPPIKPAAMAVGSIASRVVQAAKKINAEKAQADRRPNCSQIADDPPLRCVEIEPLKIALVDLEPHHCRYPYGGWQPYQGTSPITFCGHPKRGDGSSYCAAHAELVRGDRRGRHDMTDETRAIHRKLLMPNVISLGRDFSGEAEIVPT
jgi:hypothetical protein